MSEFTKVSILVPKIIPYWKAMEEATFQWQFGYILMVTGFVRALNERATFRGARCKLIRGIGRSTGDCWPSCHQPSGFYNWATGLANEFFDSHWQSIDKAKATRRRWGDRGFGAAPCGSVTRRASAANAEPSPHHRNAGGQRSRGSCAFRRGGPPAAGIRVCAR